MKSNLSSDPFWMICIIGWRYCQFWVKKLPFYVKIQIATRYHQFGLKLWKMNYPRKNRYDQLGLNQCWNDQCLWLSLTTWVHREATQVKFEKPITSEELFQFNSWSRDRYRLILYWAFVVVVQKNDGCPSAWLVFEPILFLLQRESN